MSRTRTETCASCARFPLRAAAENKGVAQCEGYEKPANWNDHACVLHNQASDIRERGELVKRLRAYGNAINAEAARVFIEAVMECLP